MSRIDDEARRNMVHDHRGQRRMHDKEHSAVHVMSCNDVHFKSKMKSKDQHVEFMT